MCYYRFHRQLPYIATEVGDFNADFAASNGSNLIEVEAKTSKSDFLADFSKAKHTYYAESVKNLETKRKSRMWIPNLFYFAVPDIMEEWALHKLQDYPCYGLLIIGNKEVSDSVTVSKQAKSLHNNTVSPKIIKKFLLRMGSDLCNLYLKRELESELLINFLAQSKKLVEREFCDE